MRCRIKRCIPCKHRRSAGWKDIFLIKNSHGEDPCELFVYYQACEPRLFLVVLVVIEGEADVLDDGLGTEGGASDGIDLLGFGILHL